jgi:hypothetical protein
MRVVIDVRRVTSAVLLAGTFCLLMAGAVRADWTGYHYDNHHTGADPSAPSISGSNIAWTSPNLAGDVFAEPLFFNGVVYVATMHDYLYALSPANGAILWATQLDNYYPVPGALPCGTNVNAYGIMGTPVIDPASGTLFAVGMVSNATYHLWAVNLATHALRYPAVVIQTPTNSFDPLIQNQRGALTLDSGQVYVPFGGRAGDCGSYHAWIFRVNGSNGSGLSYYMNPAVGAGAWARGGGVISPDGHYTFATGNGVGVDGCPSDTIDSSHPYRGVDGVLKLASDMTLFQYWAPNDWGTLSCSDTDIGSTGPSVVGSGLLFQSGKNGQGYLINGTNLGGKGGEVGVGGGVSVCGGESFGGNAYDPPTGNIYVPCGGILAAYHQSGTSLSRLWTASISAGAPIITGNAVWAIDGGGGTTAYDKVSGSPIFSDGTLGGIPHAFVSPAFGGGLVLAPGNVGGPVVRAYTIGSWAAGYDVSSVPTNWVMGHSQTFPVTVTNTGTQTWPSTGANSVDLDLHFASRSGGSGAQQYWLSSQAFNLPSNVLPGNSVTVSVTLSPPGFGHIVLEAEMIKEHEFWFAQFAPVDVLVAAATWSASYDVSAVPTTWKMGQSQTFAVVVTNTGNQTWPSTGYTAVDLDLHFASYAGGAAAQRYWLSSQAFSLPSDVAPNGSATVSVTLSPPGFGHIVLESEMIKEHQFWFDQFAPVNVSVAAAIWAASYDVSKVPTNWVLGHPQTFPVIVTNTGNQAWPSTGYTEVDLDLHFASYAGGVAAQRYWLSSRAFSLPTDVAPGASVTVMVTLSPPGFGHIVLESEMIKEHEFWFSQFAPVNVYVAPS